MNILQDQTLLQLIHEPLIAADYIEEMGKPFLAKCVRESEKGCPFRMSYMYNNYKSVDMFHLGAYPFTTKPNSIIWLCVDSDNIYRFVTSIIAEDNKEVLKEEGLLDIKEEYMKIYDRPKLPAEFKF